MKTLALVLVSLLVFVGCSVYKSTDRDDFNSNAKSRAPSAKSLTALEARLLREPCSAFNALNELDLEPLFGASIQIEMANEVSRKTSTCFVTNGHEALGLSRVAKLACSWKPVDGTEITAAADDFAVQTTEDDLRLQGLSVAASTVSSGDRLRMNCEVYVPTENLIADRASGERGFVSLSSKFSTLAGELSLATLSTEQTH